MSFRQRWFVCILFASTVFAQTAQGPFRAGPSGHFLVDRSGRPFLWLGDTAWLLAQMTTREDADLYLRTRAKQGFTVIQATLSMAEVRVTGGKGVACPNRYGAKPFSRVDSLTPLVTPGKRAGNNDEYDYWDHVDYILDTAERHGLVVALLPLFVASPGEGFRYLTETTAQPYGKFVGQRFGGRTNVIWVLGGDNTPDTPQKRKIWDRLARGIAEGSPGGKRRTTMSYHINSGNSTSSWFASAPWLDFNFLQTWNAWDQIYPMVKADYERLPHKPVIMSEGAYENGPQYPGKPVNALVIRRQAYWSYFAGGGHTYGDTDVWNFSTFADEASEDWKQALESPGAGSIALLRKFLDSLPWWEFVPDDSVLPEEAAGPGNARRVAMRSRDGARVLIYFPDRKTTAINLKQKGAVESSWFDPATGKWVKGEKIAAPAVHSFTPPEGFEDAVLIWRSVA